MPRTHCARRTQLFSENSILLASNYHTFLEKHELPRTIVAKCTILYKMIDPDNMVERDLDKQWSNVVLWPMAALESDMYNLQEETRLNVQT